MIDLPTETYYHLDAMEWGPGYIPEFAKEDWDNGIGTTGRPTIDKIIRDHFNIQAPKRYECQQVGLRHGSPWQEGGWNNDTEWTVHIPDEDTVTEWLAGGHWDGVPGKGGVWVEEPNTEIEEWLAKVPEVPSYHEGKPVEEQYDVKDIRSAPQVDLFMARLIRDGVLPYGHYVICVSW